MEHKNDSDLVRRCMVMHIVGTRQGVAQEMFSWVVLVSLLEVWPDLKACTC